MLSDYQKEPNPATDCSNIRQDGSGSDTDFCTDGGGTGGGISDAMVAAFVNRTGDTMIGNLNIYSGTGYVNITAASSQILTPSAELGDWPANWC